MLSTSPFRRAFFGIAFALACCVASGDETSATPRPPPPSEPVDCCGGGADLTPEQLAIHAKKTPVGVPQYVPRAQPNRTRPNVPPPSNELRLADSASTQEITAARLFPVPLRPIGSMPEASENRELVRAVRVHVARTVRDDASAFEQFLTAHPRSAWAPALRYHLGSFYYDFGRFSRALALWKAAWEMASAASGAAAQEYADLALGSYLRMNARIGRMDVLEAMLAGLKPDRVISNKTAALDLIAAQDGLATMKNKPEHAFRCGPLALGRILAREKGNGDFLMKIHLETKSTPQGMSLQEVWEFSKKLGMNYQPARRNPGAEIVAPAVIHWKVGHFAAITGKLADGRYHTEDPTFGSDSFLSFAAVDEEASGYFLIPAGPLPRGWETVAAAEAATVFGKGSTSGNDNDPAGCDGPHAGPACGDSPQCAGMAVHSVNLMQVGVSILDTPLSYTPPRGMPIRFTVAYREYDYGLILPQWTHNWNAYIADSGGDAAVANFYMPEGGVRRFHTFDPATRTFASEFNSRATLRRVTDDPARYEMTHPDGSMDIFDVVEQPQGGGGRFVYLSQRRDPYGNAVELIYDANFRLVALQDAIGQVTTITYADPFSMKFTVVTDPFGRSATFTYDDYDLLSSVTDTLGLTSTFTHGERREVGGGGGGSAALVKHLVTSMTTPYGTTTFSRTNGSNPVRFRRMTVTDPQGDVEVFEFRDDTPAIPSSEPPSETPYYASGGNASGMFMNHRNTFHWTKEAWKHYPDDYTKAVIYHWLHGANFTQASHVLESMKKPLEKRIWYRHEGQPDVFVNVGTSSRARMSTRLVGPGQWQTTLTEHNAAGRKARETDPVGRVTEYTYAGNGIDLLEVRRRTGPSITERLAAFTYNSQHRPLTVTDAAGQTTTYTYNAQGQTLTISNALNHVTTYGYDDDGYLTVVDGPVPGPQDLTRYTYDALGRMRTWADVDGYTLQYDYDTFDRLIKTTFPDASSEQWTYHRLDLASRRDRRGRLTLYSYNPVRQVISETDPLNRTLRFEWCRCGDLRKLFDTMGRQTTWHRDVQGRVLAKEYADGSKESVFYDFAGRVVGRSDAMGQELQLQLNLDDTVATITPRNSSIFTPASTYTYDPAYRRIAKVNDGESDTFFIYRPLLSAPSPGAGQIESVRGAFSDTSLPTTTMR